MIYKTLKGEEYAPIRRALVCVNKDGSHSILLKNNNEIRFSSREEFEKSLESGRNKFFCRICRSYNFLDSLLGDK